MLLLHCLSGFIQSVLRAPAVSLLQGDFLGLGLLSLYGAMVSITVAQVVLNKLIRRGSWRQVLSKASPKFLAVEELIQPDQRNVSNSVLGTGNMEQCIQMTGKRSDKQASVIFRLKSNT